MTAVLPVAAYGAIGVFIIAVVGRFIMWQKMPMHMRWELYPVAHEGKRAAWGGSYLEESDWWNKPRHTSLMGELKFMVPEILFLVALKEHNPKLWRRSFPFHFGLYLIIGCTALMVCQSILAAIAPDLASGELGRTIQYAVMGCGYAGLGLSLLGALGLLERRLTDPKLKHFTAPADVFNLAFFVLAFGLALLHIVYADRDFARSTAFVHGLVTFKPTVPAGGALETRLLTAAILAMALLMAYIPLTHMSHFVGKYFAYHAIRWNDKPNLKGSKEEAIIGQLLSRPVSWSASHIRGDGKRSWADVATDEVEK
jgi:nitrate reductase gamma subunit